MTRAAPALLLLALAMAGCSVPGGPFPSLQPRAAEAIDPRLPVDRPMNARPVDSGLAAKLDSLVGQARSGDAAFMPLMARAEQLAGSAGAVHSEGWIAAEEALTAAIAARGPVSRAMGDVDALGGGRLQSDRGMAPSDFGAMQAAASEIAMLDQREQDRVDAVRRRLGA
jgi:hypothetical protein